MKIINFAPQFVFAGCVIIGLAVILFFVMSMLGGFFLARLVKNS